MIITKEHLENRSEIVPVKSDGSFLTEDRKEVNDWGNIVLIKIKVQINIIQWTELFWG